jgi:dephospho-CoA kinase
VLIVALTGNIASGKSTVAEALVSQGATLIDSDAAARAAVAPGTPALAAIVSTFGVGMLLASGALDRAAMGRHVFGNPAARQALERIVHPAVEAARVDAILCARGTGASIVVCDIPLLFEAHLVWQFARVLLVDAPPAMRIERLVRERGMRAEDAAARVQSQLPAAVKRPRADIVIDNSTDRPSLLAQVEMVWPRLREWAAVAAPVRAA